MLLSIAWRNLWRNKRRTWITLSALILGVAGIVFLHSYRSSVYSVLTQHITAQLVGHIQIHGKGWQASPEVQNVVKDPQSVEAAIAGKLPGVRSERRVLGGGLAGGRDSSAGVLILGVDPKLTALDVRSGRSLGGVDKREAVLGTELAEQLALGPGSEVVLVGQAADGSVANDRYTVVGLADAGSQEQSATVVYLGIADAQSFFSLGDGVHQLLLHLPEAGGDDEDVGTAVAAARSALDLQVLEALSWNEILPELKGTIDAKRRGQYGIDVVIFMIVVLGVWNAMTMATFERTHELGVLLALGTRPLRVWAMIVVECLLEGALGLAIGATIAIALLVGIHDFHLGALSSGDMLGVRMPSDVPLTPTLESVLSAAVTTAVTVLVAALLPAWRAARLRPVEAIRS